MPNRLAHETSPYLLQHADNPVDWYPWGKEALNKAAAENKPIFLVSGTQPATGAMSWNASRSTDPVTADLLNSSFVSIKVDREERPDLDAIYMDAVTAFTGRGGWPLSVWLTPSGAPFHGGTYFPDRPRFGMPSFRQVLQAIAEAWAFRRQDLEETALALVGQLARRDLPLTDKQGDMAPPAKMVTPAEPGKDSHRAGPEWQRRPSKIFRIPSTGATAVGAAHLSSRSPSLSSSSSQV